MKPILTINIDTLNTTVPVRVYKGILKSISSYYRPEEISKYATHLNSEFYQYEKLTRLRKFWLKNEEYQIYVMEFNKIYFSITAIWPVSNYDISNTVATALRNHIMEKEALRYRHCIDHKSKSKLCGLCHTRSGRW